MNDEFEGHTPGPWLIGRGADGWPIVHTAPDSFSPSGQGVAHVCKRPMCQDHEANARLIAAAPELLDERDRLRAEVRQWQDARRIALEAGDILKDECDRLRAQLNACNDDAITAWTRVAKLEAEARGPGSFATWKDAALHERLEKNRLLAEVKALRDASLGTLVSLTAAVDLLERGGKKAAASDNMFYQMLDDYKAAIDAARAALKETT